MKNSKTKIANIQNNTNNKYKTSKQVDITIPTYNEELENSLKETITIENEYKKGTRIGYNNVNEMLNSILND